LLEFPKNIKEITGKQPPVVLEATGHYHTPIVQYLEERFYLLIIVNPLISHRAKSSSLRKVKTDAVDAYRLCELYYKGTLLTVISKRDKLSQTAFCLIFAFL